MRPSSRQTAEEQLEDLKHRLIVRAIEVASETLMERYLFFLSNPILKHRIVLLLRASISHLVMY